MNKKHKLVIVEDHPEYRESLCLAVSREDDLDLVGKFGTAEAALRAINNELASTAPDLLLLDLHLPGMSGIEAIKWFKQYLPDLNIIILTQSDREADILATIQAGASGYLLKGTKRNEIIEAIHDVINGGAPLDPTMAKYILKNLKTLPQKTDHHTPLSDRELDTLHLLSEGLLKKEIAEKLEISVHTVATFTKRIYEKLGVANAPAAISKAYQAGILPPSKD